MKILNDLYEKNYPKYAVSFSKNLEGKDCFCLRIETELVKARHADQEPPALAINASEIKAEI